MGSAAARACRAAAAPAPGAGAWVTEFQYRSAQPILAARAELLVWLRPPRPVVLARVARRTVRRRIRRELLWDANREPPFRSILTDRDHIVRWSMRTFHAADERIRDAVEANPSLRVVEVRSRRELEALLAGIRAGSDDAGARRRPT